MARHAHSTAFGDDPESWWQVRRISTAVEAPVLLVGREGVADLRALDVIGRCQQRGQRLINLGSLMHHRPVGCEFDALLDPIAPTGLAIELTGRLGRLPFAGH